MLQTLMAALLLTACGGSKSADLYGTNPATAVSVPDFEVLAQNGETRTKADLLGKPTAIWFYPVAGTMG